MIITKTHKNKAFLLHRFNTSTSKKGIKDTKLSQQHSNHNIRYANELVTKTLTTLSRGSLVNHLVLAICSQHVLHHPSYTHPVVHADQQTTQSGRHTTQSGRLLNEVRCMA